MTLSFYTHVTGMAALGLSINGLVNRNDQTLRRASSAAAVLWAVNNLLLGATSAAALSALSATRTTTADFVRCSAEHVRLWACTAFILVALTASALTWQGWPTMLTATASVIVSFAVFYLSGARLRFAMLLGAVLWSYNAWLVHSPEQIMGNSLGIAAAMYGVWKTRKPDPECAQEADAWPRCGANTKSGRAELLLAAQTLPAVSRRSKLRNGAPEMDATTSRPDAASGVFPLC